MLRRSGVAFRGATATSDKVQWIVDDVADDTVANLIGLL